MHPRETLATAIRRCKCLSRKQQWPQIQNSPCPAKALVKASVIRAYHNRNSLIGWRYDKVRFIRGFSSSSDQTDNGNGYDNPHGSITGSNHGEADSDTPSEARIRGLTTGEKDMRASELAKALPEVSLERNDEFDEEEKREDREEEHESLAAGIIGAPNAAESSSTNDTRLLASSPSETELYRALDETFNGGRMPDDSSLSMLVDTLIKEGDESEDGFKQLLFKFKIVLNTKISVALIEKFIKANKLNTAYYLFRVLRNEGVVLNLAVYNSLLTAAGEAGNFSFACPIFKDLLANGSPDSMSYFALSRAFAKVGDTGVTHNFFRELLESSVCNTTVLNRLIYAFAETGQTKSALGLFEYMKHGKCKPDLVTYNTIIYILGKGGQADATFQEFLTVKDLGHVPDIITYNTLINNFSRFGRLDLCLMLFQEMVGIGIEPDLRTYTALIDSFGRMGQVEEAIRLFHEMKEKGCKASIYVYRSLISNLKKAGNMSLANKLSEELKVCGSNLIHPNDFKKKRR